MATILISFLFFLLYTTLIILDVNNLYNQYKDNDYNIIFNFILLYFVIMFKIMISILTVFLLLLLVRILLNTILSLIFNKIEKKHLYSIQNDLNSNVDLLLKFIINKNFILTFIVYIPFILLLFLLMYKYILYKKDDHILHSSILSFNVIIIIFIGSITTLFHSLNINEIFF